MLIAKFDGRPEAIELQRLRDEPAEAAAVVRERVRHFGGDPAEQAGVWGKAPCPISGSANLRGAASAFGTLNEGEEYGIGQYENVLNDRSVDSDDKDLIRYRLLPRCHSHVVDLERMIDAIAKT